MLPKVNAWRNDSEISGGTIAVVALIGVMALVIGLGAGVFLGRDAAPDITLLADQARVTASSIEAELDPVADAYARGVDGTTVSDPAAYAEARAAITQAENRLEQDRRSLSALSPGAYDRAIAAVGALAVAAASPVPPAELDPLLEQARTALGLLAGD